MPVGDVWGNSWGNSWGVSWQMALVVVFDNLLRMYHPWVHIYVRKTRMKNV